MSWVTRPGSTADTSGLRLAASGATTADAAKTLGTSRRLAKTTAASQAPRRLRGDVEAGQVQRGEEPRAFVRIELDAQPQPPVIGVVDQMMFSGLSCSPTQACCRDTGDSVVDGHCANPQASGYYPGVLP